MSIASALVLVNADDDTDLFVVEELPAPTDSPGCLEHVYGDDFAPFDGVTWELGPDPDDARWAAENLNDDAGRDWDSEADDAANTDAYCRGVVCC